MNQNESKNNKRELLICNVKNCQKEIISGNELKIGDEVYCQKCGTLIIKAALGL